MYYQQSLHPPVTHCQAGLCAWLAHLKESISNMLGGIRVVL